MDFSKKILHLSWHPYEDTVAIAATNNVLPHFPFFLFLFGIPDCSSSCLVRLRHDWVWVEVLWTR